MNRLATPDTSSTAAAPASIESRPVDAGEVRLSELWFWLTVTAALLAAAGSVVGLAGSRRIYGAETAALADAAAAQDIVNLVLVAPLLIVLAMRARRGSLRAYLALFGVLAFTVYNYAIYAFSIHFGPLFPVWVAVLGLSLFALIGGLSTLPAKSAQDRFAGRAMPVAAWFLMGVAALFILLWLGEIVPDLLAGNPSRSATDWNIPTNPVHVLDLAFFLPAVFATGVLLLRRHRLGYLTAGGQLVWLALTCLPILVTPAVANARGHETQWAIAAPIGTLFLATTFVLGRLLRRASGSPGRTAHSLRSTRDAPMRIDPGDGTL